MKLSIIIPCYNDENGLRQTLKSLNIAIEASGFMNLIEVIVVDSSDLTIRLNDCTGNIQFITLSGRTFAGAARNVGVRYAQSEWLGFLDCGLDVEESWIKSMLLAQRADVDVVWGRSDHTPSTVFERSYIRSFHRINYSRRFIRSSMMRKRVFTELKGFTTRVHAGEDLDFFRKLKGSPFVEIYIDAQAWYNHFPSNFSDVFSKWSRFTKDNVLIDQANKKMVFIFLELSCLLFIWYALTHSTFIGVLFLIICILIRYFWQVKSAQMPVTSFQEALMTLWLIIIFDLSRVVGVIWGLFKKVSLRYGEKC